MFYPGFRNNYREKCREAAFYLRFHASGIFKQVLKDSPWFSRLIDIRNIHTTPDEKAGEDMFNGLCESEAGSTVLGFIAGSGNF